MEIETYEKLYLLIKYANVVLIQCLQNPYPITLI